MNSNERGPWRWKTLSGRERWAVTWGVGWRLTLVGGAIMTLLVGVLAFGLWAYASVFTLSGYGLEHNAVADRQTTKTDNIGIDYGICFDTMQQPGETLTNLTRLPCTESHHYEIVGVITDLPGHQDSDPDRNDWCQALAHNFLGDLPASGVTLDITWYLLDPAMLAHNDPNPDVVCVVHSDTPLSHSTKHLFSIEGRATT